VKLPTTRKSEHRRAKPNPKLRSGCVNSLKQWIDPDQEGWQRAICNPEKSQKPAWSKFDGDLHSLSPLSISTLEAGSIA